MHRFGKEPRVGDVMNVAGVDRRERGFDERPLETLSDWLAADWVDGASTHPERTSRHVPTAIRLTLNRTRDLANETELRARTLAWMIEARGFTDLSARKVQTLFQFANELRRMADRPTTLEGGTPQPPSKRHSVTFA